MNLSKVKLSSRVASGAGLLCMLAFPGRVHAEEPAAEAPTAPTADAPTADANELTVPAAAVDPGGARPPMSPAAFQYRSMSNEQLAYEFERTSLGGPIALTVVGGIMSGLALPTLMISGIGAVVCHAGNGTDNLTDCTPIDAVALASGLSTAVFGTMTIVGITWLHARSQKRSDIKNELWRRQAEGPSMTLGLTPLPGGSMLTVGGRF